MRKKYRIPSLVLALALIMGACGNGSGNAETTAPVTEPTDAHEHVFTQWECDNENHWYVCACGETVEEPHDFDEYNYCETCSVSVCCYDDGTYDILTYDAWGTMDSLAYYDAEGNLLTEYVYTTEYYEDGNPHYYWEYVDGVLVYECTYLLRENDGFVEAYVSECTNYNEDDTVVTIYDEYGNPTTLASYDKDGNLIFEEIYEYVFSSDGTVIGSSCHRNGELVMESKGYIGPDGNNYESYYISYENGEIINLVEYQHEFADNGMLLYQGIVINGVVTDEAFYELDGADWTYLAHEIEYTDEGVIQYECFYEMNDGLDYLAHEIYYDENGQISEEYRYDAEGNAIGE